MYLTYHFVTAKRLVMMIMKAMEKTVTMVIQIALELRKAPMR